MSRLHVSRARRTAVLFAALALVGCGSSAEAPADDHDPTSFKVLINGVEASAPYTFAAGTATHVQLKFYNAASQDLDDVEAEHYASLTFSPTTLATAAPDAAHHYQFDVTGGTAGSGTMAIGFGHDEMADEHSFDNVAVTVTN